MEEDELPYQKLSDQVFWFHTSLLHVASLALAIALPNIAIIFNFIGAVPSTLSFLIFPGVALAVAFWRYEMNRQNYSQSGVSDKKWKIYAYFIFSILFVILGIVIIIMSTIVMVLEERNKMETL